VAWVGASATAVSSARLGRFDEVELLAQRGIAQRIQGCCGRFYNEASKADVGDDHGGALVVRSSQKTSTAYLLLLGGFNSPQGNGGGCFSGTRWLARGHFDESGATLFRQALAGTLHQRRVTRWGARRVMTEARHSRQQDRGAAWRTPEVLSYPVAVASHAMTAPELYAPRSGRDRKRGM